MNERIRELAEQAEFISKRHNGDEWRWGYIDPELNSKLEKFAELIVCGCAKVSENYAGGSMPLSIALAIKQHFGVKQ